MASAIVAGCIVGVGRSLEGESPIRPIAGVVVAAVLLSGIALLDGGKISRPMAILFVSAIVLSDGVKLIQQIGRI